MQWFEGSQRLADRAVRWIVGGVIRTVISIQGGTWRSRVAMIVAMAVLSRQVQGLRQAGSLCRENRRHQDCEQASFHGIFNGRPHSQTVRLLTRAKLFMIIRMHSQ